MIKGTRKAIARAPHRMFGNKSHEETTVLNWTKDFDVASTAVSTLIEESNQFVVSCRESFKHEQEMLAALKELYEPIVDENVYKSVQETPQSAMEAVNEYNDMVKRVFNEQIEPVLTHLETVFTSNCSNAKECINSVEKALKKREHKKLDYDRFTNTMEKYLKKKELTDKEQKQLNKVETEAESAMEIFHEQDAKCKELIPQVLSTLSEFLNPMTATIYLAELRVYEILKTELYDYALSQGLISDSGIYSYEDIMNQWEIRFLTVQPACEQGIKVLRDGEVVKKEMSLPSSKKENLKNFFNKTKNELASSLDRKIIFSDQDNGMFSGDNIVILTTTPNDSPPPPNRHHHLSSSSKRSISSSASTSTLHTQLNSPITMANNNNNNNNNSPSTEIQTRVRALSSSSAQALSPFAKYAIQESNEYATALYTFLGDLPGDVAFRVGDTIKVLDHGDDTDPNWWFGMTKDGRIGLFPCNYVALN